MPALCARALLSVQGECHPLAGHVSPPHHRPTLRVLERSQSALSLALLGFCMLMPRLSPLRLFGYVAPSGLGTVWRRSSHRSIEFMCPAHPVPQSSRPGAPSIPRHLAGLTGSRSPSRGELVSTLRAAASHASHGGPGDVSSSLLIFARARRWCNPCVSWTPFPIVPGT
jgi:hypothetical protein